MPILLSIPRPLLETPAAEWLLLRGVSNAAAATLLAVGVALVCRVGPVRRRPAVVHGLWLLVLLKLLLPPVWSVSVAAPASEARPLPAAPAAPPPVEVVAEDETAPAVPEVPAEVEPAVATAPAVPVAEAGPGPAGKGRWADRVRAVAPVAVVAWAVGTAACLLLAAVRIARFRRVLRHASPAPREAQARTAALSAEMGLRPSACPGVWFVPGAVSPMLWALPRWLGGPRGARLLLPGALWDQLDHRQRDAILLHELAHLRRRDHWVRLLELAVTALWWWHPVAWWARRRLREAEEQCCDAWVVWARPASVRHYATALLEALDFAAGAILNGDGNRDRRKTPALPAVPALASGMAEFHELKRRLVMIKQGSSTAPVRKLSWFGLAAVCGMAALLLPVVPNVVLAQEATTSEEATATKEESAKGTANGSATVETQEDASARPVAEKIKAEQPAEDPYARKPTGKKIVSTKWDQTTELQGAEGASKELAQARAEVEHLRAQLAKAEYHLKMVQAHAGVPGFEMANKLDAAKTAKPGWNADKAPNVTFKQPAKQPTSDTEREARLRRLEDNLSVLLQEVKALRDERATEPRTSTTPKAKGGKPAEPADDYKTRVR